MITAVEAKELYDTSGVEADRILNQIEPIIIKAATAGERSCFVYIDSIEIHRNITVTALQEQVLNKMQKLGYRISVAKYGSTYVPRGLSDDDGNGPKYENYGYSIHW